METHRVIISLASNCDQEQNLQQARLCLKQVLCLCHYTEAIWTEPFSPHPTPLATQAPPYLNQLVQAETTLSADELQQELKAMEAKLGRTQEDRRQGIVRIDLDLLLHGTQRFHLKDWSRPYVTSLLPQL